MQQHSPHILQIIGASPFGGATRVILAISYGLLAEGYHVSVLADDAKTERAFSEIGIPVIPSQYYVRAIAPLADIRAVRETVQLCRDIGVDALHTHTSKGGAVGRIAAGLLDTPVVHTVHGFPFHEFSGLVERTVYGTLERIFAGMTTRLVMMNSDEFRLVTEGQWCSRKRIAMIPNGIAIPPLPPAVEAHGGQPILATVGRLAEQKGYRYLLEAMPLVLRRYPAARLMIIGDGEQRAMLETQARQLGLGESVAFTGFQSNPLSWLLRAHVAVSSSLWEGMPIAVLEMMAARRPLVATTCKGTRDVLEDGVDARLAPPGDAPALAEAICAMLDDQPAAAALADAARRKLETCYSVERMVNAYVALFKSIVPVRKEAICLPQQHAA